MKKSTLTAGSILEHQRAVENLKKQSEIPPRPKKDIELLKAREAEKVLSSLTPRDLSYLSKVMINKVTAKTYKKSKLKILVGSDKYNNTIDRMKYDLVRVWEDAERVRQGMKKLQQENVGQPSDETVYKLKVDAAFLK